MTLPRTLTGAQKNWLKWMTGLSLFAAGVWYEKFPMSDYLLGGGLVGSIGVGVWYFRPANLRAPRTSIGAVASYPAGPRELLPNLVTALRPFLGLSTALAVIENEFWWAYFLYLGGNLTDLLDGAMARSLNGTTATGKDFDAIVDALFNSLSGLGLFWLCVRNYPSLDWQRLTVLGLNVVGFSVAQIVWGAQLPPEDLSVLPATRSEN